MRRLVLATTNKGKAAEFRSALRDFGLELVSLNDFPQISHPWETGKTFAENARIKATHYFDGTKVPCLADDSGLCIPALDDWPGVQSARVASTDGERIQAVLSRLEGRQDRDARFECALCLAGPDGLIEVPGAVEGRITESPRGSRGFGYDPIFYYPPLKKTFGELPRSVKNDLSHRARALARLRNKLA